MRLQQFHFPGPFTAGTHDLPLGGFVPAGTSILTGTIVNDATGATLSLPHAATTATNAIGLSVLGGDVRLNIGPGWSGTLSDVRVTIGAT